MFKSKAINIVMMTMVILTLISAGLFYYMNHKAQGKTDGPTVSDIVDHLSVATDEMTTNLKDDKFIKVSFLMQVSNKDAKTELEKRQFQVKNTILYLLSNKTEHDLEGQKGIKKLETSLKDQLNQLMKKGQIVHVYTTEKIIQ
jgi:flagellar protein FliL